MVVDHINLNGLDNRRENLRLVTPSQNAANSPGQRGSSKYRGVHWDGGRRQWIASVAPDGKQEVLGSFYTEEEAARAYDAAAVRCYGECAYLNFPPEGRPEVCRTSDPRENRAGGVYRPSVLQSTGDLDPKHPLYNMRIAFTGELRSMPRREAAQAAVNCGAKCTETVSSLTDYVVVGGKAHDRLMARPSGRLKKALDLGRAGGRPRIITESEFLSLLAVKTQPPHHSL